MNDVAANAAAPAGARMPLERPAEPADAHLGPPGSLTPAEALARLCDRRERQVAHMLRGMASAEHPDEWRDMDRGAGRLTATLLAETQLLIQALREVHPELRERLLDPELVELVGAMSGEWGFSQELTDAVEAFLHRLARRP